MGKSFKRTSICGNAVASSEKQDKRLANRRFRRNSKQLINCKREPCVDIKEVSNVYSFNKDGKHYFSSKEYPQYMRK